jgi:hypothetical protein
MSRVEGHRSRVECRGRGSKVEVEGQKSRSRVKSRGSKVENTKFLSIFNKSFTTIKRGKTISFAVKWLCRMAMLYGYVLYN